MIRIDFTQLIMAPPEKVLQVLLDHENLDRFFKAKITLEKVQDKGHICGGQGAIRQITLVGVKFQEQIISACQDHISYRIIGKGPVTDHQGDIYLKTINTSINSDKKNDNTVLNYVITCCGPKWFPDFIAQFVIARDIKAAMKKVAEHFYEY